jgi:type IV secretion system protein VirB9
MKFRFSALWLTVSSLASGAPGDDAAEKFFSPTNTVLSTQEQQGLAIAKKWQPDSPHVKPIQGEDGSVVFRFGDSQTPIVCAVLQICTITLAPGEHIQNFMIGDRERWNTEPASSGSAAGEVQHVIVKPLDVGLKTNMVIFTDQRTYFLQLASHRSEYMPHVSFSYPDTGAQKWDQFLKQNREREEERVEALEPSPGRSIPPAQTNASTTSVNRGDAYDIDGKAPWRPTRVWHDFEHTYIDMPKSFAQGEAPVLLAIRGDDSVFPWGAKAEQVMINYRVQGSRYIVDSLPERMMLVTGAGDHQTKVVVTRRED